MTIGILKNGEPVPTVVRDEHVSIEGSETCDMKTFPIMADLRMEKEDYRPRNSVTSRSWDWPSATVSKKCRAQIYNYNQWTLKEQKTLFSGASRNELSC